MSNERIRRGLLARQRRAAVAQGDTQRVADLDKQIAAPVADPATVATEGVRKRLVGGGYAHLDGPEISALRASMTEAGKIEPPASSTATQKISAGLAARTAAKRHDESFIEDWPTQGGIRRT